MGYFLVGYFQSLLGLLLWTNIVLGAQLYGRNITKTGVTCDIIQVLPESGEAYISIKGITNYDLVDLPVLILKSSDFINFTNILNDTYYNDLFTHNRTVLYDQVLDYGNNIFNLSVANGFQFYETNVYNGLLSLGKVVAIQNEIQFPVQRTGTYCIFIAPPVDVSLNDLSLSTSFISSYGHLEYSDYLLYVQLRYFIILDIVLFTYLNYIANKARYQDGLVNFEVVSNASIYYILLPSILVDIYEYFLLFLENNYPSLKLDAIRYFDGIISEAYKVVIRYFMLLFALGYGSLYYHNDSLQNYSKMPSKTFFRSNMLLLFNCIIGLLSSWRSYGILNLLLTFLQLSWYVLTFISYFRTKRLIKTYPVGSIGDTAKAFSRSICILFISPLVRPLVFVLVMIYVIVDMILTLKHSKGHLSYDLETDFINKFINSILWQGHIKVLLLVSLAHFIWFKSNRITSGGLHKADITKKLS